MWSKRLFELQEGKLRRVKTIDTGKLLYRNDDAVEKARRSFILGYYLALAIVTVLIFVFSLFAIFIHIAFIFGTPVLLIPAVTCLLGINHHKQVDVIPELYERGMMEHYVESIWHLKMFLPYDELERPVVKGDKVILQHRYSKGKTRIESYMIGEKGLSILNEGVDDPYNMKEPPDLVLYKQ